MTDRPWLASYPAGVPADIDPSQYRSLVALMEESFRRYADRVAYSFMGTDVTYAQVDAASRKLAGYLQGLGLARGDRVAALQGAATGRLGRLRAEIDRRRRPLLLGLAAIVLALGALQAITMRGADEPPPAAPTSQVAPSRGDAATVQRDAPDVSKDAVKESAEAKPAPADPTTTQALPSPVPAEARPNAKSAVPQVSGMNTLQAELGNLPPALAKVKLAALDGDGAAIWDLATREADGRGMPRDLSIAAKLYEKLASAGYAPAQYKLAGHYEKGSGVVRDLDKAKLWYGRAAEQGHAIPGPLPLPDGAVARLLQRLDGKGRIHGLEFLQRHHVGLLAGKPFQQPRQPGVDAIDVEGGELEAFARCHAAVIPPRA